jgi:hypothetical protein
LAWAEPSKNDRWDFTVTNKGTLINAVVLNARLKAATHFIDNQFYEISASKTEFRGKSHVETLLDWYIFCGYCLVLIPYRRNEFRKFRSGRKSTGIERFR